MGTHRTTRRSDCPTGFALDLFGDRWTLLVVRDLMFNGRRRFGEFRDAGEGIATNVLSERLSRLEECGIVVSERDPENHRSKLYRLTEKGIDLLPLMVEMIVWSAKHDPDTAATRAFVRRAKRDREGMLAELTDQLRQIGRG
jgi:DNA-binding HxlR family transcriptional regulator